MSAGAGQAKVYRILGATGVETYCTWQTVEDGAEGAWDWSRWDEQVQDLQEALTHFDVPYEAGDTHWSRDGTKIAFVLLVN